MPDGDKVSENIRGIGIPEDFKDQFLNARFRASDEGSTKLTGKQES